MMLSEMAAPRRAIRPASHSGTRPPCRGRSAMPERFMKAKLFRVYSLQTVRGVKQRGGSELLLECSQTSFHGVSQLFFGRKRLVLRMRRHCRNEVGIAGRARAANRGIPERVRDPARRLDRLQQ